MASITNISYSGTSYRLVGNLGTTTIGSEYKPIYINSAGNATVCSYLLKTNIPTVPSPGGLQELRSTSTAEVATWSDTKKNYTKNGVIMEVHGSAGVVGATSAAFLTKATYEKQTVYTVSVNNTTLVISTSSHYKTASVATTNLLTSATVSFYPAQYSTTVTVQ